MNENDLYHLLNQYWGFRAFRPLQKESILSILSGVDTLTILSTGSGKSLIYQLPALLDQNKVIVVSPLIALMEDQVKSLQHIGIKANYLHSGLNYRQIGNVLDDFQFGKGRILFVAPERFSGKGFIQRIHQIQPKFFAIDEAHCISQWGHDFRPSYLELEVLKKQFPKTPIIALTATASPRVTQDIISTLGLKGHCLFQSTFARENLHIEHRHTYDIYGELLKTVNNSESSIIYFNNRGKTEMVARFLTKHGVKSAAYHANLDFYSKRKIQEAWTKNKISSIVATNAFGMGIDKADVRTIVHLQPSFSIEEYYQEIGRAGRDGKPSKCILLYNKEELKNFESAFDANLFHQEESFGVYQRIAQTIGGKQGLHIDKVYNFDIEHYESDLGITKEKILKHLKNYDEFGLIKLKDQKAQKEVRLKVNITPSDLDRYTAENRIYAPVLEHLFRQYPFIDVEFQSIDLEKMERQLELEKQERKSILRFLNDEGYVTADFLSGNYVVQFLNRIYSKQDFVAWTLSKVQSNKRKKQIC